MGSENCESKQSSANGLLPRICKTLFEKVAEKQDEEIKVRCSHLQIYNEKIYDLLNSGAPDDEEVKDDVTRVRKRSGSIGESKDKVNHGDDTDTTTSGPSDPDDFDSKELKSTQSAPNSARGEKTDKNGVSISGGVSAGTSSITTLIPLKLRCCNGEFFAENLFQFECDNVEDLLGHFRRGVKSRIIAETAMNLYSSRSHAIFEIQVENKTSGSYAKLQLVDLAGSERQVNGVNVNSNELVSDAEEKEKRSEIKDSKRGALFQNPNANDSSQNIGQSIQQWQKDENEKQRFQECCQINQSLFVLRKVISCLAKNRELEHIPFRESKLTCLLQPLVYGNSNTIMIACLSPGYFQESLSTLHYASLASKLRCFPVKNEDPKLVLILHLRKMLEKAHAYIIEKEGKLPKELEDDASTAGGNINVKKALTVAAKKGRLEVRGLCGWSVRQLTYV